LFFVLDILTAECIIDKLSVKHFSSSSSNNTEMMLCSAEIYFVFITAKLLYSYVVKKLAFYVFFCTSSNFAARFLSILSLNIDSDFQL